MNDNRIQLNGIKVHPFPSDSSLLEYVEEHKGILVAINAEKILHANEQIQNIVNRNIGYCDGIGAVMAVRQHGAVDAVKIAGCELWLKIITALYQKEKTFYLVGSKQPVIEKTISRLKEDFPGIQITGYRNGYIQTETEQEELIEDIKTKQPDVIFVAMGSPKQELLMEKMYQAHPAIYQGLGGSFRLYRERETSTRMVDKAQSRICIPPIETTFAHQTTNTFNQILDTGQDWKNLNRNNMKKIMLVFGTRPEAIKMAPLVKAFQQKKNKFETIVCVTGQHRKMLDQVLKLFNIRPDYDLNIMRQGQDLYDITARVLTGMRGVLQEAKPDIVLVHGDTTTSTASALAAFYQQIPVGHVEAGLRTHNIYSPWPEEMNTLLKQLDTELMSAGYETTPLAEQNSRKLVLITGHRRENFGDGFIQICRAIKTLAEQYAEVDFVYPMHLNPNVRKPIHEIFGNAYLPNLFFIEPLEYLPFVYLMEKSTLVLTDSGGIQEEAPGLGKPVLVMRDTTERPEALDAGTVKLVGTDYARIVTEVSHLLDDNTYYNRMSQAVNPYGDGTASQRIVQTIEKVI